MFTYDYCYTFLRLYNLANIFLLLFLSLLLITLVVQLFMPAFVSLIAPGCLGEIDKMEIAISLTRITFPFLFCQ